MLSKVKVGDQLAISAATFNSLIDVAQEFQQRQRAALRRTTREQRDAGIVLVRNDSGADRKRFDVLGVSGPVITPTDNADAFKERVAIKGVVPTGAETCR